ncbi:RnfABCDGE type electron transport complex subunit D [Sphaerochaeta sp. PS]|uniref:RnfABCDGE type electron transport complex subunit D n=1 Tax=Sphaerochaeta sp. PS TaxID=3076336 RepID=UPI0028A448E2|nr:RnfABCDGE type electron transport complex subunit D [Sphaerochaeta sp. PS]MDT4762496.1 RnfABCDGE type electron transport complex subunit D [Sphaerochaeta sp. PS]
MKIQKQQAMRNVLYALAPLCLAATYFFGWRFIAVLVVVGATGLLCEWLMARRYGYKITESLFVSCTLFALSLPPTIPLWIAALGIAFGIIFGKMIFGGFGKNIFNPAITARAFVYISFGVPMTARFIGNATSLGWFPAGFGSWITHADSVSAATPLLTKNVPLLDMFLGFTSGSFGETSAVLILLGGLFILYKKTANWKIVVASIGSFLLLQTVFWATGLQISTENGLQAVASPMAALLGGSFLFAAFFMITDPVSASQSTDTGRWIYGAMFGILTVLIRTFSTWVEGVTFAILLANMFAPLLDTILKGIKAKKKLKATQGGAA